MPVPGANPPQPSWDPRWRAGRPAAEVEPAATLTPQEDGWVASDAWVLSAVRVTGTQEQPASLMDLVAAGDFLNRVILSIPEIEHAVGRLAAAMLITVDERGFAITPVGRQVVARARGGVVGRDEALLKILSMVRVRPVPFQVNPREYEAACLEHRHRTWKAYGNRRGIVQR